MEIVVNADDFGWSDDTVAATIESLEAGLLTSATIMVGKPATEAALAYARSHPGPSFGVHLLFVGDGSERPLSAPAEVPGLVDEAGRLLPTNVMRKRALLRQVPVGQIQREIEAQIDLVRSNGVEVTHVDSHRHLHKFAPFRAALSRALPRFGIVRVRNVQDVYIRKPVSSPTYWSGTIWRRSLMKSFVTTDHFYMPTSAHDVGWDEIASHLPPGRSLEVGLHPGSEEAWRAEERGSLAPFVERAREAGHVLVGWQAVSR
jgi:chitin disaccharide deacetylase